MKKGGTDNRMDRLIAAVERNAEATEQMLTLAKEEQIVMAEPGPPVCPFCGKLDPEVTELGSGGSGKLSEFVIRAETHCCNRILYALPVGWDTTTTPEMAADIQTIKKGGMSRE
jgi:hypothetical protein